MEQKIEPATEYYAFIYTNDGESDDIDDYIDCEERDVEIAVGAVCVGELTSQQSHLCIRHYRKELKTRKLEYVARFVERQSIPPSKETELKLLLFAESPPDGQEALDTLVRIANAVRKASDCESKNVATQAKLLLAESTNTDFLPMTFAASGKGNPISALEMYHEQIEQADAPADVFVKNKEPITTSESHDSPLVGVIKETNELLKKQNRLIEKGTTISKKGFGSLKPVDYQSLAELVKTLPPLKSESEDENWVARSTVSELTGEKTESLRQQRRRGETISFEYLLYGKDTEGRIWCKVSEGRKVFYLKNS